jgi:uncharacterized DUF497 family protein
MAHGDRGFRWNYWNVAKVEKHGLTPADAEHVVRFPLLGYPMHHKRESWIAKGQTSGGTYIQVVYLIDPDFTVYVIHAMPLVGRRQRRRRRRGR